MAPDKQHECEEGADGDSGCSEEVGECAFSAFFGNGAVFVVRGGRRCDGEDGDDLRYAREHAGDCLACHYRLRVCPYAEARDICENAVLAEAGCEAGSEDDGHKEAEVEAWGDGAEEDCGEGEEGEGDDVED